MSCDLIFSDSEADIALLKIRGTERFPFVDATDLTDVSIGQPVIAGDRYKLSGKDGMPAFSSVIAFAVRDHFQNSRIRDRRNGPAL